MKERCSYSHDIAFAHIELGLYSGKVVRRDRA